MSTPLVVKLRQAAVTNAGLTSVLGSAPFRWYNTQLYEGSAYPAITANQISSVPVYSVTGRNPLARARVQFTIWEGQTPDDTNSVLDALRAFLDSFSAVGNPTQFANQINSELDRLYPATQPPIFQTLVDAYIYNSDSQ